MSWRVSSIAVDPDAFDPVKEISVSSSSPVLEIPQEGLIPVCVMGGIMTPELTIPDVVDGSDIKGMVFWEQLATMMPQMKKARVFLIIQLSV